MRGSLFLAAFVALVLPPPPAKAQTQMRFPHDTWEFTLEFKRMPMAPTCIEKFGRGRLVKTRSGRNPTYVLTGFPEARVIRCGFANGGRFEIDALRMFDLPDDSVWQGTIELMGPGDIRAVRARYTYKNIGPFVEGTFWFDTYKGEIKESGGSIEMWDAIKRGARQ